MYCFWMLLFYYAFQSGTLYMDTLIKQEQQRFTVSTRQARSRAGSQLQAIGDALFCATCWMQGVFLLILGVFLRCDPHTHAGQLLLVANALPSTFHLLLGVWLIRTRMASIMVHYAVASGALVVGILTLLGGTWPLWPRDHWAFWLLPSIAALLYRLFFTFITTGRLLDG